MLVRLVALPPLWRAVALARAGSAAVALDWLLHLICRTALDAIANSVVALRQVGGSMHGPSTAHVFNSLHNRTTFAIAQWVAYRQSVGYNPNKKGTIKIGKVLIIIKTNDNIRVKNNALNYKQ